MISFAVWTAVPAANIATGLPASSLPTLPLYLLDTVEWTVVSYPPLTQSCRWRLALPLVILTKQGSHQTAVPLMS